MKPPKCRESSTQFLSSREAGVKVAMGTDSGAGCHEENGQELWLMVENGMTPLLEQKFYDNGIIYHPSL